MAKGFRKYLTSLRGSRFASDVTKLGGGTALGQGIFLVASPFITRIYSPEEMGLFGIFLNLRERLICLIKWFLKVQKGGKNNEKNICSSNKIARH